MRLYQDTNWKAVHFPDKTILKSDGYLISNLDWEELIYDAEVEPTNTPGHYMACTPTNKDN